MLHPTNLVTVRDGVTFLCGIPGIQRTGTSLWWVPVIVPHLPDDGEGWCDLPVWNPRNTEDRDISLVDSCSWMTPPWCPGTDLCDPLDALTPPSPHP
ncbi:unnamed protein product, partial [Staurois parvus]